MEFLESLAQLPSLLKQVQISLDANTRALEQVLDILGNTRLYEADAADYLGVQKRTMQHYRRQGLIYEQVGRIFSYRRADLDAWRERGRTRAVSVS